MKDLVSIVVPVYNVEKYLERCINSLVNQTYSNIEILLIDDGSIDDSGVICDKYAKKDSRIKVIHKDNEGLGFTRNVGIDNSKGKYITFVDSDDYIDKKTIFDSLKRIKKDNADIVMYGLKRVSSNGTVSEYIPNPKKNNYKDEEILNDILPDYIHDNPKESINRNFTNSSCTCLFKTSLFKDNNIRYISERKIVSEDTYMMLILFSHLKSVSIINECYYYYCENFSSLSHGYRSDRYKALKHFHKECNNIFDKNNYNNEVRERFDCLFLEYILAAFKTIVLADKLNFGEKYRDFNEIIKDDLYRKLLKNIDMKKEPLKRRLFYNLVLLKQVLLCMLIVKLKYR